MLGLLLLIAVAVVLFNLHQSLGRVIHTSRMELEGVALIKPFSRTLQSVQRHRGLSSALLNGADALRDKRALTEKEAADAFDTLREKLPRNITAGNNWQSIKTDWRQIQRAGLEWTASENFDSHTRLVSKLLDLEGVIADKYELSLDPDFDSYYLFDTLINHLPLALEHLGQLRAYGASILAKKQITEAQKAKLNRLFGEFSVSLSALKVSLAKTGQYNWILREPLSAASRNFSDSSQKIIDQVYLNILNGSFGMSAEDFFMMATAVINDGYAQITHPLVPEMEALLKARIAHAENTLYLSIGIALLLFMVVVYFSLGIYFAASETIRTLARSAHIIAAGNLHERVNLDTRNELKQVGDSFNEMAEGFQRLLTELRQSEERWKFALEGGGDGVWDWNIETGELFFSRRCKEVLGITETEGETYKNWEATIHPDLQAYLDGKTKSYYNEHHIVLKDGSWKWILDRGMVVDRGEDGKPLRMIGTRTDITERKQAEEVAQAASQYARSLIEASLDPLVTISAEGKITDVNTATEQVTGMSRDKLIGSDFADYFTDPEQARAGYLRVFSQGFVTDYPLAIRHVSGKVTDVLYNASVYHDGNGNVLGVFAAARDITERKQAELAKRRSEQQLQAFYELDLVGLAITSPEKGWIRINDCLCKMLEYPEQALHQMTWAQLTHAEDLAADVEQFNKLLANEINGYALEKRFVTRTGKIIPTQLVVRSVRKTDGKLDYVAVMVEDITEYKQAEAELKRSNAELEQFAYAVSHDMRQPLRMVTSYLSLIESALSGRLNEETQLFLHFAMDGAKRMDAMILSLLDYSRVGRKTEAKTLVSSRASLDEALAFLNPELSTCGGEIKVTGVWPELFASRDELTRLLQNLIGNALKYHEQNQPPQVHVHGTVGAGSLRVEVRDRGIGIEPSQLERLFKVFSRLQARSRFEGTGIGLALCRKIVEHHGGSIGVESEGEGQGCMFWFELPLAAAVNSE